MATLKLNLGAADTKIAGWINIDSVEEFRPDVVHDLAKGLPYPDKSVDEILAKDLLEHFDKYMRFVVFYDWARVLKVGGTITLEVPNFKKLIFRYFKFGFDNFVDMVFGENMIRSQTYSGHYGNHKWGYSTQTLTAFVRLFGVEPVSVECRGLNIIFRGKKTRHVDWKEIENIEIYAHANAFGNRPTLTLKEAREKIEKFL